MAGPGVPPPILSGFGAHTLAKGTTLHRFCAISRRPNVFNPCMGDVTRYAPLYTQGPARVCSPTLYIGESYDAAAFETIFRNLPRTPLSRQIRESDLHDTAYGPVLSSKPQFDRSDQTVHDRYGCDVLHGNRAVGRCGGCLLPSPRWPYLDVTPARSRFCLRPFWRPRQTHRLASCRPDRAGGHRSWTSSHRRVLQKL